MEYAFLETSDEALVEGAKLPLQGGVAVAMFTTGYSTDEDEAVSFSIVDLSGKQLFAKTVKPHNKEDWAASESSGGIGPADVEEAPALYDFEDEIMEILGNADFVLCQHLEFVKAMLDRSWIMMPTPVQVDVCEMFRLSHSAAGRVGEPATVATLEGIAGYYGFVLDTGSATEVAQGVVRAYKAMVAEFISERDAKGEDYWAQRDRRLAEENASVNAADEAARMRERRYQQMNALLWVAAGIIFVSLIIQLYQRGGDIGMMVIAGAAAVFAFARAVVNWNKK